MNGIEPSSTVLRADSCSATADVNTLAESWKRQGLSTPVPLHEQPCQRFLFSQDCQTSTYTDGQEMENGGKNRECKTVPIASRSELACKFVRGASAAVATSHARSILPVPIFAPNLFIVFSFRFLFLFFIYFFFFLKELRGPVRGLGGQDC